MLIINWIARENQVKSNNNYWDIYTEIRIILTILIIFTNANDDPSTTKQKSEQFLPSIFQNSNTPNSNFQKLTSWQLHRENLDQKFDFIQFKNHQSTFRQSQAANTPKPIHAKSHQVEFRSRNKTLPLKARAHPVITSRKSTR